MLDYVRLGLASIFPVIVAIILYIVNKKTKFKNLPEKYKQIIYGVIFALFAILGTHVGIPVNGAQINCRDACVLIAGLLFGAPAGIIAGVIAGVERYLAAVLWNVGTFTKIACSVSTTLAGFYAAALRKFMFEDKKPVWILSFAIGVVIEVFHLTMVFLTNMSSPLEAMAAVKACTAPMVIANAFSVLFATMALGFLANEIHRVAQTEVRISQTIQRWLAVTIIVAFIATSFFVYSMQNTIADTQTASLLDLAIDETVHDIADTVEHSGGDISTAVVGLTKNRHVGNTGYVLIIDQSDNVVSVPDGFTADEFDVKFYNHAPGDTFKLNIKGETCHCRYVKDGDYFIIAVLPQAEAYQMRNIAIYVNTFMEILVFAILFALIYQLIKRVVVNQIKRVNSSLAKITGGDLGVVVDVRTNAEFASLSDDINSTVATLKRYIEEASARIDRELEFAKNIQSSALPNVFPAFPKRKDIDIYALMDTAKEVGGDFYDFYITDNDLNFLVADVSGKGIPAAMFMMRAKTELKSLTEADVDIAEVFTRGNDALCEGNDASMFVTAWQGGLNLETGLVKFVNAGHNPPLVKHKGGKFEYLRTRAGLVLAGMEDVRYRAQELNLMPGDVIFLYTDGVTEATNEAVELYGEQRLLDALNSKEFGDMKELCDYVKADVDEFVGDAPQFDDITMLALRYIGEEKKYPSVTYRNASLDNIPEVQTFVESELEKLDCMPKVIIQMNVAIDEIYSNIVRYGYPNESGEVTVEVIAEPELGQVSVRFTDSGIKYNPLEKPDPDVTLSLDEREVGGLGIFMVKKTMDEMKYEYVNDKNVLTLVKKI